MPNTADPSMNCGHCHIPTAWSDMSCREPCQINIAINNRPMKGVFVTKTRHIWSCSERFHEFYTNTARSNISSDQSKQLDSRIHAGLIFTVDCELGRHITKRYVMSQNLTNFQSGIWDTIKFIFSPKFPSFSIFSRWSGKRVQFVF